MRVTTRQARLWVGIDAGKGHHWAVAVNADGETLFSTKVINDEAQILTLIATARDKAGEVRWAVDISGRASALLYPTKNICNACSGTRLRKLLRESRGDAPVASRARLGD